MCDTVLQRGDNDLTALLSSCTKSYPRAQGFVQGDPQGLWVVPSLAQVEGGGPREEAAGGEEEEAGASSQGEGKCIPSLEQPPDQFSWKCCRKVCFGKMSLERLK